MIVISPKSPVLEIFMGKDHFLENSGPHTMYKNAFTNL